jgi:hypothetical protein
MTGPVDGVDLDRVWLRVAARVWRREPGPVERVAAALLRSPGLARALLTTPSLLLPWLLASAAVFCAGAAAPAGSDQPLVALVAPAVAAAGIAYAYGPGVDPAGELTSSAAVSERMLLLVRVLAVFGVNAAFGLAASAATATAVGITLGWLLPMAAVSALALAVATLTRSAGIGTAAGLAGWVIAVLTAQNASGRLSAAVSGTALLLPYLAFAVAAGAVAVLAGRSPRGLS